MGMAYWIMEYVKVLFAYGAIFYVWPYVVFYPYLKKKEAAYKFAFCTLIPVILDTTVITLMGILHILYGPLVAVIFYGVFVVQFSRYFVHFGGTGDGLRKLTRGTLKWKRLLLNIHQRILKKAGSALSEGWKVTKGSRLKYAMLLLVILYAMLYFGYGAFQFRSYGASDQYVHHSWIYALTQGQIYPRGIYPEGMHCIIYLFNSLFGLKIYSVLLFLAGIHVHATLLAAYLLMCEFYHWIFTPVFVLIAFLTVNPRSVNILSGITRLSWTLPQEFAFPAVFLCAFGLYRYIKSDKKDTAEKWYRQLSPKDLIQDENLFLFLCGTACTIVVHFYATIMAAFVCVVIAGVYFLKLFHLEKLSKLAVSTLLALLISVAPMGIALLAGYHFQGSIHWAIAVTRGGEDAWANGTYDKNEDYLSQEPEIPGLEEAYEDLYDEILTIEDHVKRAVVDLYYGTLGELYPGPWGIVLYGLAILVAIFPWMPSIVAAIGQKYARKSGRDIPVWMKEHPFNGYLCVAVSFLVLLVSYRPNLLNLPILIAGSRLCVFIQLFGIMVYGCLADLFFYSYSYSVPEGVLDAFSLGAGIGIYFFVRAAGIFHGYLYYEVTRYPQVVDLTEKIIEQMPQHKYTILSTTDEYYQVIGNGYHEELLTLSEHLEDEKYEIPTRYVFVYIEKHPIYPSQINTCSGPEWLAFNRPLELFTYHDNAARYPQILHGEISEELAKKEFGKLEKLSDAASYLGNREILESKAYVWYQKFSRLYPNDGKIVYEDDDFLCYCICQNEYDLFTLGIF